MSQPFDSWESYFYPDTIDPVSRLGTLRNLFDERDPVTLARLEYVETAGRALQLERGDVAIARTYDGDHLRAIHRHLFQDVYEWAGEYRTVDISKGVGRGFAEVTTDELDRMLRDTHRLVDETDWAHLDRGAFVDRSAEVFAYVNQAHPFREGNGRTSKLFMQHIAEQSPYTFDFARVTPEIWNQGSALSRPDLYDYAPQPASLIPVFDAIAVDRRGAAASTVDGSRSALRASYPQAPGLSSSKPAVARENLGGKPSPFRGFGRTGEGRE